MKRKSLRIHGEEIFLNISRYENNNRLAILAQTKEEPYCDVTINLPEINLDMDSIVAINSDCKYSGLDKELIKENIIESVLSTIQYNWGQYDIAYINIEKLYEFDPEGFEKYINKDLLKTDEEEAEA